MVENCILLFHLSTGDNFTMYAMVIYYSIIYKYVNIFCLHRNINTIKQMYDKNNNIIIHLIENKNYNGCIVSKNDIDKLKNKLINFDIISTGMHNNNFDYSQIFWRCFYKQVNLDYDIRYIYNNINRNYKKEKKFYNKIINKYGNKYIFLNDHRHLFYKHIAIRPNIKITHEFPIFHSNINYYNGNKNDKYFYFWKKKYLKNNLFDYCMIIENATEIHITDSAFSCLCPYLDLSKVEKKCIYTKYDYVNYHNSFKDWIILPYQN